MGLDDGLAKTQNGTAAVLLGVEVLLELHEGLFDGEGTQLGEEGAVENALHTAGEHLAHALHGLEQDVARIAVGDQHVAGIEGNLASLHVAHEIDVGAALEKLIGLGLEGGTLMLLGTVVEQAHAGVFKAVQSLHVGRAHGGELGEEVGLDRDVGTAIQQQNGRIEGQNGGQGGTVDPLDAADGEGRSSEQGARIGAGHQHVALPIRQRLQGEGEGGVLLLTEGHGVVLHGDHGLGVEDLKARDVQPVLPGGGLQDLLMAHQQVLPAQLGLGVGNALEHFQGGVIAAHAIDDDSHCFGFLSCSLWGNPTAKAKRSEAFKGVSQLKTFGRSEPDRHGQVPLGDLKMQNAKCKMQN